MALIPTPSRTRGRGFIGLRSRFLSGLRERIGLWTRALGPQNFASTDTNHCRGAPVSKVWNVPCGSVSRNPLLPKVAM